MTSLLRPVALAVALLVPIAQPVRAEERALSCPIRWGEPGKPLVTSPETAKAIFLAVEKDFFPGADPKTYPGVDTHDYGDHWAVFRWRPPVKLADGSTEVTEGGGQLELSIAKCDAAISNVHFSR